MSGESSLLAAREVAPLKNFVDTGGKIDSPGGIFLMDCDNERFFTYNHQRNSICVGNIRDLGSSQSNEDFRVQEEIPLSKPPTCVITKLILHPLSSEDCIVWGEKAAIVLRLGYTAANKLQLTRETFLAEKLYQEHPHLKIIQCKWVPVAAQKIILILNSDSFVRVYNADTGDTGSGGVLGVFNFGLPECVPLMTKYSPDVDSETPVDFDFGPFLSKSKLWTVFVLKISGIINCAMLRLVGSRCIMDSYQPIDITGDSSSSSDSNSILCSQNSPVALVIGSDCGSIKHLILLPTSQKTDYEEENDCEDQLLNRQFVFHTREKIQLVKHDRKITCKFFFAQDPIFDGRYACVHNGGIHLITLKFLEEMHQFLKSDENELPTLSPSVFQHLMTWSFGSSSATKKSVGLCFTRTQPQKLICCLTDDKTIVYSMPHVFDVLSATKISGNNNPFLEENRYRESGSVSVLQVAKSMLPDMPPYFCSDQNMPTEGRLEVLKSTVKLKGHQINGLHDATQYLLAYLDILSLKSDEFKTKISKLLSLRQSLKDASKSILDHYNKYAEKDEILSGRMENLLSQYHQACPVFTDQEKLWKASFVEYKTECDKMKRTMDSLDAKINDIERKDIGEDTTLTPVQLKQIKDEIAHQHEYISKIVKYVNEMNKATSTT